jgi:hypothetical protein
VIAAEERQLTGRRLLVIWLLAATVLGGLLAAAEFTRGPLDDPDPAQQRPGILDLGLLPEPASAVSESIPRLGRPAVVFFGRPDMVDALCRALPNTGLSGDADLVIVLPTGTAECRAVPVIEDPDGSLAEGYGMRSPIADGSPVGYAVVDDRGRIRYRTLDPAVITELGEVRTIVAAL